MQTAVNPLGTHPALPDTYSQICQSGENSVTADTRKAITAMARRGKENCSKSREGVLKIIILPCPTLPEFWRAPHTASPPLLCPSKARFSTSLADLPRHTDRALKHLRTIGWVTGTEPRVSLIPCHQHNSWGRWHLSHFTSRQCHKHPTQLGQCWTRKVAKSQL